MVRSFYRVNIIIIIVAVVVVLFSLT